MEATVYELYFSFFFFGSVCTFRPRFLALIVIQGSARDAFEKNGIRRDHCFALAIPRVLSNNNAIWTIEVSAPTTRRWHPTVPSKGGARYRRTGFINFRGATKQTVAVSVTYRYFNQKFWAGFTIISEFRVVALVLPLRRYVSTSHTQIRLTNGTNLFAVSWTRKKNAPGNAGEWRDTRWNVSQYNQAVRT